MTSNLYSSYQVSSLLFRPLKRRYYEKIRDYLPKKKKKYVHIFFNQNEIYRKTKSLAMVSCAKLNLIISVVLKFLYNNDRFH